MDKTLRVNTYTRRELEMFERTYRLVLDHPFSVPGLRAGALVTQLADGIGQIRAHGSGQVAGYGTYRAGAAERRQKADALRETLRAIRETAVTLDREVFPGLRERFRMTHSNGYQALLDLARAFRDAIRPVAVMNAFLERGWTAGFDEDLAEEIDAVEAAVMRKHAGRQAQKEGTANLRLIAARTLRVVRELGAIVNATCRLTNPGLVAVWRAAARVARSSRVAVAADGSEGFAEPLAGGPDASAGNDGGAAVDAADLALSDGVVSRLDDSERHTAGGFTRDGWVGG